MTKYIRIFYCKNCEQEIKIDVTEYDNFNECPECGNTDLKEISVEKRE